MTNVLTIDGVTKYYGRVRALNKVSFTIPAGCIYGILGPNGSGKTTLLGIIMDILRPTSGSYAFYDGATPNPQVRKRMGTLLETPNFYHYLSAERNLRIAAEIKERGMEQIDDVLTKVNLYERRRSKFSTFSLGMKQRLAIASALRRTYQRPRPGRHSRNSSAYKKSGRRRQNDNHGQPFARRSRKSLLARGHTQKR